MIKVRVMAAGALVACSALAASIISGDARRGEHFFQTQQCIQCHSFRGKGGTIAPDLARRIDRDYTPATMASLMWNHAPDMWATMRKQGITRPTVTTAAAADLFAFFVSARYFERPGDAARGKAAFAARHCAECHGITTSVAAGAPPVVKWESLADPIVLAQQMWNHGAKMKEAFAQRKLAWEAYQPGPDGHPGLSAEPAGDQGQGDEFRLAAGGFGREAVPDEGLHKLP